MDDGRLVRMQVHQALQNLPGPPLQHLLVNVLVLLAVPTAGAQYTATACEQSHSPVTQSLPGSSVSDCQLPP